MDTNHIEPSKMLANDIFIQKRGKITPSKIKQKLNWDKNRNYENVLVIIFNLSTNLALIQSYSHHPRVIRISQILPWRIPLAKRNPYQYYKNRYGSLEMWIRLQVPFITQFCSQILMNWTKPTKGWLWWRHNIHNYLFPTS